MRYAMLTLTMLLLTACDAADIQDKAKEVVGKMEEAGKAKCEGYIDRVACSLDTECEWADDHCAAK